MNVIYSVSSNCNPRIVQNRLGIFLLHGWLIRTKKADTLNFY